MKKSVEKEPFLQTLARQVGRTAGAIARATQAATGGHAAVVKTDGVRRKATQISRRRSISKNKSIVANSSNRKPRAGISRRPT